MAADTEYRRDYAGPYRSRERAEAALEDMFACGEVCEGEFPLIERRGGKVASWAKANYRYFITVRGI